MVENFGIKLHFAPVVHPQSNGETPKKINPRKSTGETPYSLIYGTEVLIQIEVDYQSLKTQVFDPELNETGLKSNLDFLKQRRETVELRCKAFQELVYLASNTNENRKI